MCQMPPPYIPVGLCTDQLVMSHDHINRINKESLWTPYTPCGLLIQGVPAHSRYILAEDEGSSWEVGVQEIPSGVPGIPGSPQESSGVYKERMGEGKDLE